MNKSRKWTFEECQAEAEFIKAVNPANVGSSFNHDSSVFAGYCEMQSKQMRHSGFPLFCKDIADALDIARFKGIKHA